MRRGVDLEISFRTSGIISLILSSCSALFHKRKWRVVDSPKLEQQCHCCFYHKYRSDPGSIGFLLWISGDKKEVFTKQICNQKEAPDWNRYWTALAGLKDFMEMILHNRSSRSSLYFLLLNVIRLTLSELKVLTVIVLNSDLQMRCNFSHMVCVWSLISWQKFFCCKNSLQWFKVTDGWRWESVSQTSFGWTQFWSALGLI